MDILFLFKYTYCIVLSVRLFCRTEVLTFCLGKHQDYLSKKVIPPHTSLLNSKTGVHSGITIFLIFDPKHRLWVLVRTASARRF